MKLLVIAIISLVLFFPAYWLFHSVVGPNWGAGITAVGMYIFFPFLLLKVWKSKSENTPIEVALAAGELSVSEFNILDIAEIEDLESGELHYIADIGNDKTLCLRGNYLFEAFDQRRFPSTKVTIYFNKKDNISYGIECRGDKLIPLKQGLKLRDDVYETNIVPENLEVINQPLLEVMSRLSKNA